MRVRINTPDILQLPTVEKLTEQIQVKISISITKKNVFLFFLEFKSRH
jgi:hypothetical protein